MGERGAQREPATADDIAAMGRIVRDGVGRRRARVHHVAHDQPPHQPGRADADAHRRRRRAGRHRDGHGRGRRRARGRVRLPRPRRRVRRSCAAWSRRRAGRCRSRSRPRSTGRRGARCATASSRPPTTASRSRARSRRVPSACCSACRPRSTPSSAAPSYREIARLPLDERVRAARATPASGSGCSRRSASAAAGSPRTSSGCSSSATRPTTSPTPSTSVAAARPREGRRPGRARLDLLLADDGTAFLYYPLFNWVDGSLDAVGTMLADEHLLPGLADGGAHVGTICDASFPTTLLTHWARDRAEGLPLEWVVRRQSRDTAGRGRPRRPRRARARLQGRRRGRRPRPAPAPPALHGVRPARRRASGSCSAPTATSTRSSPASETYADGEATDALPGRLVRGPQAGPG